MDSDKYESGVVNIPESTSDDNPVVPVAQNPAEIDVEQEQPKVNPDSQGGKLAEEDKLPPDESMDEISEEPADTDSPVAQKVEETTEASQEVLVDENLRLDESGTKENMNSELVQPEEVVATDENANKFVYQDKNDKSRMENDTILEPLIFDDHVPSSPLLKMDNDNLNNNLKLSSPELELSENDIPCMLCEYVEYGVENKAGKDNYLCHLLVGHFLVVADVKLIADLRSYAMYWKRRFSEEKLETFCSKILTNTGAKDKAKSEEYFLLCDALPEDKQVREELQLGKLKQLLLRQEFERVDKTFKRMCPFCTKCFQGNRLLLFNHMSDDHNFNIGHPDNIVNVRDLLNDIEHKLESLHCLFCEKVFKDRPSLREHMRKKAHRKLNPKNKDFDKYYIINYLELGKNWESLQGESDRLDGNQDDWSGWNEEGQQAVCFFCEASFDQSDKVYEHMTMAHDFDFAQMRQEMQMSFYQQVKMINYIRRQVHLRNKEDERTADEVATIIIDNLRTSTKWNQPQYYFPTYENDSLLCQLEDKDGLFEPEDTFVIGEDGIDCRAIINHSVLTDLVVGGYFDS